MFLLEVPQEVRDLLLACSAHRLLQGYQLAKTAQNDAELFMLRLQAPDGHFWCTAAALTLECNLYLNQEGQTCGL